MNVQLKRLTALLLTFGLALSMLGGLPQVAMAEEDTTSTASPSFAQKEYALPAATESETTPTAAPLLQTLIAPTSSITGGPYTVADMDALMVKVNEDLGYFNVAAYQQASTLEALYNYVKGLDLATLSQTDLDTLYGNLNTEHDAFSNMAHYHSPLASIPTADTIAAINIAAVHKVDGWANGIVVELTDFDTVNASIFSAAIKGGVRLDFDIYYGGSFANIISWIFYPTKTGTPVDVNLAVTLRRGSEYPALVTILTSVTDPKYSLVFDFAYHGTLPMETHFGMSSPILHSVFYPYFGHAGGTWMIQFWNETAGALEEPQEAKCGPAVGISSTYWIMFDLPHCSKYVVTTDAPPVSTPASSISKVKTSSLPLTGDSGNQLIAVAGITLFALCVASVARHKRKYCR